MGWRSNFLFLAGAKIVLQNVKAGSGVRPALWALSTALKRPECQADQSSLWTKMLGMIGALLLLPTYAFMACKEQLYTCLFSYQVLIYHSIIYNVYISNYVPLFFNKLSLTSWSKTQVSTMFLASAEVIRSASSRTRT
jgi:hypothetical protein